MRASEQFRNDGGELVHDAGDFSARVKRCSGMWRYRVIVREGVPLPVSSETGFEHTREDACREALDTIKSLSELVARRAT